MTKPENTLIEPGRPVRLEPTAPGFWALILGVAVAAIAPLLGLLVGTMLPRPEADATFGPTWWGLMAGILIGAAGVVSAVLGGMRLYRHVHSDKLEEEAS